jgi:AraC-like DNA-binding protein
MRQVTELRFQPPTGGWSLFLSPPPPELAPFVKVFWEVHGFGHFTSQRVLPKTTLEVTFNLGPPHRLLDHTRPGVAITSRRAWVSGLRQRPLVFQPCFDVTRIPFHFTGVGLSPAGAFAFFGIPMNELTNDVIELDMLAAARFGTVHAQLLETPARHARFQLIESMVCESMRAEIRVRPFIGWAATQIERAHGTVRISDLAREIGVSRKHLNEWFQQQIGLSPKQYAGVARFQRLVASLTRSPPPHWADLAQECGFYDQAHLVHDCRAFAGMTPNALRATLSPDGNGAMEI